MTNTSTLVVAFFRRFLNHEFFVDLGRAILYPTSLENQIEFLNNTATFIDDVRKTINELDIKVDIDDEIEFIDKTVRIKQVGNIAAMNYSTVDKHFAQSESTIIHNLIKQIKAAPITNDTDYNSVKDFVYARMQAFYELKNITPALNQIDSLSTLIQNQATNPFEALKIYEETVLSAYNSLTNLKQLHKEENFKSFFTLSDEESFKKLTDSVSEYLFSKYNILKTGYRLLDGPFGGVESSSVYVVSAPSNHGKSILLVNILSRILNNELPNFKSNDAILFVTLEDDIYKLLRRFISIIGNQSVDEVKRLFRYGMQISRRPEYSKYKSQFEALLSNTVTTTLYNRTQGKVSIILKHSEENTFTPTDLAKFIDRLKVDGYNVRAVFADYIDVFVPTIHHREMRDYDAQGTIVQELRTISRAYKLPIITATQNRRSSETSITMSNEDIGDSYKKVRYSDYIFMCRQRRDKDITEWIGDKSIENSRYILSSFQLPPQYQLENLLNSDYLIPFEMKTTKAKEGKKDDHHSAIFFTGNLRIYESLEELSSDLPEFISNSSKLSADNEAFGRASGISLE